MDGGCVSAYTGAHSHTSLCGRGLRLSRRAGLGIDHSSPLSGNMILWPSKAFPKCWHPACLRTGWSSLPATGTRAPGTSVCPVAPAARPPGQCMGTSHGIRWLRVGACDGWGSSKGRFLLASRETISAVARVTQTVWHMGRCTSRESLNHQVAGGLEPAACTCGVHCRVVSPGCGVGLGCGHRLTGIVLALW